MHRRVFRQTTAALVIAAIAMAGWAAGKQPLGATKPGGWTPLFNGRNLDGWEGDPAAWTVRDGAIWCTGKSKGKNWLIWRGAQPGDFELRLQFRFVSGNSGVQVRSKEIAKWQVRGYQVEIAPQEKMGLWHHSLPPEKYRAHLATAGQRVRIDASGQKMVEQVAEPAAVQAAYRDGQWNELVIVVDGPHLVQKLNGVVLAELTDEDQKYATRRGVIALQDHGKGTVVGFKDLRIRPLRHKAQ